jgi:hypothetical protein
MICVQTEIVVNLVHRNRDRFILEKENIVARKSLCINPASNSTAERDIEKNAKELCTPPSNHNEEKVISFFLS